MGRLSAGKPHRRPWPTLRQLAPTPGGPRIAVDRPVCVVGARSRVHLALDSGLVSRTHALIVNDADETYIRDLASANRVYVNGATVREARLQRADILRIGPFAFQCASGLPKGGGAAPAGDDASGDWSGLGSSSLSIFSASLRVEGHAWPTPILSRTAVIGTRSGCDVMLPPGTASGVHAVVFRRGGERFVRDLNSKGGTFLNGKPVREARLNDGDEIRVGTVRLWYAAESTAAVNDDTNAGSHAEDATSADRAAPDDLQWLSQLSAIGLRPTDPTPSMLSVGDLTTDALAVDRLAADLTTWDLPATTAAGTGDASVPQPEDLASEDLTSEDLTSLADAVRLDLMQPTTPTPSAVELPTPPSQEVHFAEPDADISNLLPQREADRPAKTGLWAAISALFRRSREASTPQQALPAVAAAIPEATADDLMGDWPGGRGGGRVGKLIDREHVERRHVKA